jgi:hypothetical protein
MNTMTLGRFLKKMCGRLGSRQIYQGEQRPYVYEFPTLADCRARWDKLNGEEEWGEEPIIIPEDEVPF